MAVIRPFTFVALILVPLMTASAEGPVTSLAFPDQFGRTHDVAKHRGEVVVLVYGDRQGAEASRALGAALHVAFHPAAAKLPPAQAHTAPVRPVPGAEGRSPEVRVVPVACTGYLPSLLRPVLVGQFRKAVPDVPVWLDFDDAMKDRYGLAAGVPNVVVFDAAGRMRRRLTGNLSEPQRRALVEEIEGLRREAVGG